MDTRKLEHIQAAVRLVNRRAREAVAAARDNRDEAYRLLEAWSRSDATLADALRSVGLLLSLKEDFEKKGQVRQASSIESLICEALPDD